MQTVRIASPKGQLEACQRDDLWTVRLANMEARARYLDLALAELLGNAPEAHRAAAKLLTELADVPQHQEAADLRPAAVRPRKRHGHRRPHRMAKPLQLGLRALSFAVVASIAFLLTTWLSMLR